ncbi:MAG: hypothetical protein AABX05_02225 [Nanoarchaeota archaeon]
MSITKESAFLYVYSKQLTKVNKKIHEASKEMHEYTDKYHKASEPEKKHKFQKKHHKINEEIKDLLKDHNALLSRLKHHLVNFHDALGKQLKH